MTKYTSGRQKNLKVGISSYSENLTSLEVIGASVFSGESSGELVRISQIGTGPAFLVEDSANPDTTPFVVTTDGRVAIGLGPSGISTNYKLEVDGNGDGGDVRFVSGGQGDLIFSHSNLVSNIRAAGSVQLGLGANGGDAIRINLNNNVGLGTTTPTSKLYVVGDVSITGVVTAIGGYNIGIQSGGINVVTGVVTALNFIGIGNTFNYNQATKIVDISIQGGGGGGSWVKKTANYTALAADSIIADTSGGSFTITLPASPSIGNSVKFADGGDWYTNNVIIARNGSTIEGLSDDFALDIKGIIVEFVYDGSTWEIYSYSGPEFAGGTLTNNLTLTAGTNSISPLTFQSGTNLTAATSGVMEYDGKVFYSTPNAISGRAISPSTLVYRLNSNLSGNTGTSAQNALGVSITVSASTVYEFEYLMLFQKTAGTNSHNFTFAGDGTSTLNNAGFNLFTSNNQSSSTTYSYLTTSWTGTDSWTGITDASIALLYGGRGTLSINASGTLNLTYALSADPGGAYSTLAGSFFMLTPIGASGSNISVGAWA